MKPGKIIRLTSSLLILLIILSGCSYVQFENDVKSTIEKMKPSADPYEGYKVIDEGIGQNSTLESGTESKPEENKRIIYSSFGERVMAMELLSIGDSCNNIYKYSDGMGGVHVNGKEGVTYTLNGVEVYDSYNDSEYASYGYMQYEGITNEEFTKYNAFVVAEFTVRYDAPETENETDNTRIRLSFTDLEGLRIEEKVDDDGYMRTTGRYSWPVQAWFSDPPTEDDPELDPMEDNFTIMIDDGEERTVKIGYLASHELVETKNVFISIGYIDPGISGSVRKVYELFPDENNDKFKEKPVIVPLALTDTSSYGETVKMKIDGRDSDAIIKHIGDKLPAFKAYRTRLSENIEYIGDEGLFINLDNVTVYDSFEESGLSYDNLYYFVLDEALEKNKFVVVDITVEYNAPEDGEKTIKSYADLHIAFYTNKQRKDRFERSKEGYCTPMVVWYSGKLGEKSDYTAYTISEGEKYQYKLGILTAPEYIEMCNVNLEVCSNNDRNITNDIKLVFELIPES